MTSVDENKMMRDSQLLSSVPAIFLTIIVGQCGITGNIQYPQGYYPFEESPARIPPMVRKPPYLQTQVHKSIIL